MTIIFTPEATYNGRKRFEARVEGAAWDAPRVVIEQTYGLSRHGATRGQRLGPADHWTVMSKVGGRQEQLHNGWGSKAEMKKLARAWLEQRASGLGRLDDGINYDRLTPKELANLLIILERALNRRRADVAHLERVLKANEHPTTRDLTEGRLREARAGLVYHERQVEKIRAAQRGWGARGAMGGMQEDVRGLVRAASLLGGLSLGRAGRGSAGLHRTGRRSTGETALRLRGRVAGVDPATAAVDIDVDGYGDIRTAQPRASDRALQQQVHRRLRVGLEVVLDAATSDEPPQAARRVTLVRIVGVRG